MYSRIDPRRPLASLVLALSGLAWLSLWLWGQSPYSRYLSHHSMDQVRGGGWLTGLFLAGWLLMTIAMMLPTSLPLIDLFSRMTASRPDHRRLVGWVVAGYLVVWMLFGLGVYVADALLHALVEQVAWLQAHAWALGAGTFMLAGLYQFSPLKYQCLDKCRSPRMFILEHWRGRDEMRQAFRLGAHHGLFCVGCCWSLMLLMFAVGVGNVGWMLTLGLVMAIEKNLPWGRRLSKPLGIILVVGGLLLGLTALN